MAKLQGHKLQGVRVEVSKSGHHEGYEEKIKRKRPRDPEISRVTRYIAAMGGERYQIVITADSPPIDMEGADAMRAELKIDGEPVDSRNINLEDKNAGDKVIIKKPSGGRGTCFSFAKIERDTLEDNDYNSAALGEIRLEMFRLKQTNKSQQHTGIGADRPDAQPTLVKPTLKDPAAWRTLYTNFHPEDIEKTVKPKYKDMDAKSNPYATFIFIYREKDFIDQIGLVQSHSQQGNREVQQSIVKAKAEDLRRRTRPAPIADPDCYIIGSFEGPNQGSRPQPTQNPRKRARPSANNVDPGEGPSSSRAQRPQARGGRRNNPPPRQANNGLSGLGGPRASGAPSPHPEQSGGFNGGFNPYTGAPWPSSPIHVQSDAEDVDTRPRPVKRRRVDTSGMNGDSGAAAISGGGPEQGIGQGGASGHGHNGGTSGEDVTGGISGAPNGADGGDPSTPGQQQ